MMKILIYLVCAAALALTALVFGRSPRSADLILFAWAVAALSVIAGVATWRVTRRRERQKIEGMRDSALW